MSKDIRIRIKKTINIRLKNAAPLEVLQAPLTDLFAIQPENFQGITPKLAVKVGDEVLVGDVLFFSKSNAQIKFTSPISGTIQEVKRGAKRKILAVIIKAKNKDVYKDFGKENLKNVNKEKIIEKLLQSGCWPFIKRRPYDIIASPEESPRDIFISAFDTAPLAPNYNFIMKEQKESFQVGILVLSKIIGKKINVSTDEENSFLDKLENINLYRVTGKHPAGNVGVQISKINPINAGECIWTVNPQDVCIIGKLFLTGNFRPNRMIAVSGSAVYKPIYYKVKIGQSVAALLKKAIKPNSRVISGNVLTGTKICVKEGFLGFYDNVISVIPEGNVYRLFGWIPFLGGSKIHSVSKTSFSWLLKKQYNLTTNMNGEQRAMVVTGEMEKAVPMDIYPMQLLKAILAKDIEKMENLGIYEVIPEDFALIDYVSSSKIEAQTILREGLDLMIKEVG